MSNELTEDQKQQAATLAADYRAVAAAATKVAELYENPEAGTDKESFLAEYEFVDLGGRLANEFVMTCALNGASPQQIKAYYEGEAQA